MHSVLREKYHSFEWDDGWDLMDPNGSGLVNFGTSFSFPS